MTTEPVPVRVISYARVSRTTINSVSPERQHAENAAYAAARPGWTIVATITDPGVSGSKYGDLRARPAWKEIEAVPAWDVLLVWKLDRFGRTVLDALLVQRDLEKQGRAIAASGEPVDFTTTQGRMAATMMLAVAEQEAANISARVKSASAHLLRNGRAGMQQSAYHLHTVTENGGKVAKVHPDRRDALREVVHMITEDGTNLLACGRWLASQGLTPARSDHWTHTSLRDLLTSPTLYGAIIEHGQPLRNADGTVKIDPRRALLSRSEWDSLQATLDGRRGQRRPANSAPVLLRGCVLCEGCRRPLLRTQTTGKPARYICTRAACNKRASTYAEPLEQYVVDAFLDDQGDREVMAQAVIERDPAEVAELREAITAAEERANAAMRAGNMQQMVAEAQQRTELQQRLDALERPERRAYALRSSGKTYRETYAEADGTEARNRLLKAWLPTLVLHGTHAGRTLDERLEWLYDEGADAVAR